MSRPRLHFHTDCAFFAGCESMLAVLFADTALRAEWDVSFSYRRSDAYDAGLRARIPSPPPAKPLDFPDMDAAGKIARLLLLHQFVALWSGFVLWRLFGRLRPAVVHINNGGWPGAGSCRAAIVAARLRGARVICVVNNIAVDYGPPRRWQDWPLDRLAARCADRWVVANRRAKDALVSVLRLDPEKVSVIPNGMPPRRATESRAQARARLGIPEDRTAFACIALFEERKGHALLIKAIAELASGRPPERMPLVLIEGDGPGRAGLERLAAELGVAAFARFVGCEKNVFDLLAACDGLVEASISGSPSPNVVAEAMGLGLAVIASVHSSDDQIENDMDGLLVDPRDAAALAAALARATDEADLRGRLGAAARAAFDAKFSAARAAAAYRRLDGQVAGGVI